MERRHLRLAVAALALAMTGVGLAQEDPLTRQTREVFEAYAASHDASYFAEDALFYDMTDPGQPQVGRDAIAAYLAAVYGGAQGRRASLCTQRRHVSLNGPQAQALHHGDAMVPVLDVVVPVELH